MRRSETQPLRDVINEYINSLRMGGKIKEVGAVRNWPLIVGSIVARSTTKIYIRDRKLYVTLSSPVVKHQLSMLREGIVDAFNKKAEADLIDDIVLY